MDQLLTNLHDAEDFFHFYQVPYDKKVIAVARTRILKRFNQYLVQEDLLDGDPRDPNTWEKQRNQFIRAYDDFRSFNPAKKECFLSFINRLNPSFRYHA